jgi:hypothetical protein
MTDLKKKAASRFFKKAEELFQVSDFDEALRVVDKAIKLCPIPEAQDLKLKINAEISAFGSWGAREAPKPKSPKKEEVILLPPSITSKASPKRPAVSGLSAKTSVLRIDTDDNRWPSESKSESKGQSTPTPTAKRSGVSRGAKSYAASPVGAEAKGRGGAAAAGYKAESKGGGGGLASPASKSSSGGSAKSYKS